MIAAKTQSGDRRLGTLPQMGGLGLAGAAWMCVIRVFIKRDSSRLFASLPSSLSPALDSDASTSLTVVVAVPVGALNNGQLLAPASSV